MCETSIKIGSESRFLKCPGVKGPFRYNNWSHSRFNIDSYAEVSVRSNNINIQEVHVTLANLCKFQCKPVFFFGKLLYNVIRFIFIFLFIHIFYIYMYLFYFILYCFIFNVKFKNVPLFYFVYSIQCN